MRVRFVVFAACIALLSACQKESPSYTAPVDVSLGAEVKFAVLKTSKGTIKAKLFADKAPKTVANFIALAQGGKEWRDPRDGKLRTDALYKGILFHRVIPGFMIQTGDPRGDGMGNPGYTFEDEISELRYDRAGLLGMANYGPNTNGCQFFITLGPAPHLNGRHTIFGELVDGLAVAQAIAAVPRVTEDGSDRPLQPVYLESVTIYDRLP